MDAAWLGALALRLALAGGVATTVVALRGRRRPARWLLGAVAVPLTVATAALGWALVAGDFDVVYVADTTDRTATWPYRLAGLWGGMDGSLLLWTWLLALAGLAAAGLVATRLPAVTSTVCAVTAGHATAFVAVSLLLADPFRRLDVPALDGAGLSPVLRHPAMLYHPPLLYAGLVACLAVAAVAVTGDGERWRALVGVTAGVAWVILTVGLVAGAHWAYVELGWGGYWAWDPVENAGLLPWLALTGLVHAARDRRSPPRLLAGLAVTAHALALLGAFLTRSGSADSVHAFAEATAIGRALLVVLVVVGVAGAVVVARRPAAARPSRSTLTVVVLSLGAVVVVGLGTVVPVVSGAVGAGRSAVDGTYFARFTTPIAVLAVVLLVVLVRRRVPVGALVGHIGFVVLLIGFAGSTAGTTTAVVLPADGEVAVEGYRLRHEGIAAERDGATTRVQATVGLFRGDDRVATLHPERVARTDRGLVTAEASLRSTLREDVLVTPRRIDARETLLLDVTVRPLVVLVWWGGLLVALGAALGVVRTLRTAPLASGRAGDRRSPAAGPPASAGAGSTADEAAVPAGSAASGAADAGSAPIAAPRPPSPTAPTG